MRRAAGLLLPGLGMWGDASRPLCMRMAGSTCHICCEMGMGALLQHASCRDTLLLQRLQLPELLLQHARTDDRKLFHLLYQCS